MWRQLVDTPFDRTLMFLRVVLGIVFLAHGMQKMLGWFGGPGFNGAMNMFTVAMHIPAPLAFLAIATEFFGSIALLIGFLARLAGLAIAIEMAVAVLLVHVPNGFFMNWTGNQPGEGFEYHILATAIALTIMLNGAGAWSLDHVLARTIRRGVVA